MLPRRQLVKALMKVVLQKDLAENGNKKAKQEFLA
jgi:hypothetical protein